jgi:glucose-6-phosphate 1-dehydrogenase
VVRGQYRGYRDERGVAPNSRTETFAALHLEIDSWRWKGVPFYVRAGKWLPVTCTEILLRLRKPPAKVLASSLIHNHVRLRISPDVTIAMSMMALAQREGFAGQVVEMLASSPHVGDIDPYERLLGAAMEGDATSFAREDYVEEAWRIVEPILDTTPPPIEYEANTWGPPDADRVAPRGGWHNPTVEFESLFGRPERSLSAQR